MGTSTSTSTSGAALWPSGLDGPLGGVDDNGFGVGAGPAGNDAPVPLPDTVFGEQDLGDYTTLGYPPLGVSCPGSLDGGTF